MTATAMATREAAIARAEGYFDEGRFRSDLAALVAYETESQDPARKSELRRYLDEAMRPRLEASGFACAVFGNPDPRGGPILVGARIEDPTL